MVDKMYIDNRIADLYDLFNPWANDNEFYLSLATDNDKLKILDLGCGTGKLSLAFSENGHMVVGCDPAPAMLQIAKEGDRNRKVEWVLAGAQDYTPTVIFDLIVMTGHTFQILLTDEDVIAVFRVVKQCLDKDGIFVFETRNPNINWMKKWSESTKTIQSKSGEPVKMSTNSFQQKDDTISFTHYYTFPDETIESSSTLRFLSRVTIEKLLEQEGLRIIELYGYWDQSSITDESPEMIFKVAHK